MEFSVLMSVYLKEKPTFLDQSLNSLFIQTVQPTEVVLVKDGPLTDELEAIIDKYVSMYSNKFNIVELNQNQGLGIALSIGLEQCKYELIARMDSDDICESNRFKKQLQFFEENKDIDVVGGDIIEFYDSVENPVTKRVVPTEMENITSMMKRRNPLNHMTVMFKKSAVIRSGGYMHLPYLEDYYLWIRMVAVQCKLANIRETLVYVRTGEEMYRRRGNKETIKGWYVLQKKMISMNLITNLDIFINMINIIVFTYMPVKLKEFAYKKLLRK